MPNGWRTWRPDADLAAGLRQGCLIGIAAAVLILPPLGSANSRVVTRLSGLPAASAAVDLRPHETRRADFGAVAPTDAARYMADWIADSADNRGLPFALLDKRDARVHVFDAQAQLIGSSPVLLGAAPGDDSVAGIGQRPIAEVRPEERTTPAGRFDSAPGRNASGEDVVWVDYGAAVSMHRVRPVDPKERRLERLASHDPAVRRISYGCINVPVAFFEGVVQPALGGGRAVVYVLPESKSLQEVFVASYAVESPRTRELAQNRTD